VTLGDVARHIDPAKEDRHASGALALQCRQAMTNLLEARPIEQRQSVHVVAFGAGRLPEMLVWHQHGPGCIIGETYLEEFARGVRTEIGIRSHLSDGLSQRHHCNLVG
jgi:hypothetical protein